jgi:hypothetical protein
VLERDHVGVAVLRELWRRPSLGLLEPPCPTAVRQDDVVLRHVQRLARAEHLARELRLQELRARPSGAVEQQHGVANDAPGVPGGRPQRPIVKANFRQRFPAREAEVADDEVASRGASSALHAGGRASPRQEPERDP